MRGGWVIALIWGVAAAADVPTPVQGLIGAPLVWWEAEGWRHGTLELAPDGAAQIVLAGPGGGSDTGRWWAAGTGICTQWARLRAGAPACYTLRRDGAGRWHSSSGTVFERVGPGV